MKKIYLFTISILIFSSSLNAQWVRTSGPSGRFYSLAATGTNLFAGNNTGNIFRSTDHGASWTIVFSGSPNSRTDALAISDTNIFAANDAGVLLSTNNGISWTVTGLVNLGPQALAVSGPNIFAGTYANGVFLSTNNGTSWTEINTGLTGSSKYITALFVSDTNLFAGTWGGSAFRSTNNGTTWTSVNNGLTSNNVHAFTAYPQAGSTNLFAGTYFASGVYLSTDNGGSWMAMSTGLTNTNVRALAHSDTNLFAGTDGGGVFRSTNNGISWSAFNTGLTNLIVNALIISDTILFAGTNDGVWRRPLSDMITSVSDQIVEIPSQFKLEQNYPNPFNPSTKINYQIPIAGIVSLKVYNVLGKEITALINEEKPAGSYEITWNASDYPSGVYFLTMQAGQFTETRKIILMK